MPEVIDTGKLRPCPHCGTNTAEIRYRGSGCTSPYYYPYEMGWVECSHCKCGTSTRFHVKDAVEDWNRRPEDDPSKVCNG